VQLLIERSHITIHAVRDAKPELFVVYKVLQTRANSLFCAAVGTIIFNLFLSTGLVCKHQIMSLHTSAYILYLFGSEHRLCPNARGEPAGKNLKMRKNLLNRMHLIDLFTLSLILSFH
jgi:hypothetical protein